MALDYIAFELMKQGAMNLKQSIALCAADPRLGKSTAFPLYMISCREANLGRNTGARLARPQHDQASQVSEGAMA
jgi:hypothetical protein